MQKIEGSGIITYTLTAKCQCSPITNYTVVDTLPGNVTYVSGGTYNGEDRTVKFNVASLTPLDSIDFSIKVRVNEGSYYPGYVLLSDSISETSIPNNFVAKTNSANAASNWTLVNTFYHSAPASLRAVNTNHSNTQTLTTANVYEVSGFSTLSFWHKYDTEPHFDGGRVFVSTDGGISWVDVGKYMTKNGYNDKIKDVGAFAGNSNGFIQTVVDLKTFKTNSLSIRFVMTSDDHESVDGWYLDDIEFTAKSGVTNTAWLYNDVAELQSASIVTTPLVCTVKSEEMITACNGYSWNGKLYLNSGDYVFETLSASGCDSIATLHLTVNRYSRVDTTVSAIDDFLWYGTRYTSSGQYLYKHPEKNAVGCDSLSILTLTITKSITYVTENANCYNTKTGSITVNASAGVPPFKFKLNEDGTYRSSNVFQGLKAGTYTVYMRDAKGVERATEPIVITQPPAMSWSVNSTTPSCNGVNDASMVITAYNGVAPYMYKLGGSGTYQESNTFSNLAPGNYNIYYQDATGCEARTGELRVNEGFSLTSNIQSTNLTCNSSNDGTLKVNITSGTPPYMYRLSGEEAYQQQNSFSNLKPTIYRVYLKDAVGCIGTSDVATILKGDALTSTFQATDPTCSTLNNGSITVNVVGGASPFKYKLGGNGTYQGENNFNNLKAGSYRIYFEDAKGCTGATNGITLAKGPTLSSNFTTTNASCEGASDGSITVNTTNGVEPYMYKLRSGGTYQPSGTFSNLKANTYKVFYYDASGCAGAPLSITVNNQSTACNPVYTFAPVEKLAPVATDQFNATLYPNPSNSTFTVRITSAKREPVVVNVFNATGQKLTTLNNAGNTIKLGEQLRPGIYLIEVKQGQEVKLLKGIKMK